MMKFLVVAVLVSCALVEQSSALLPDIPGIIAGLSEKAIGILNKIPIPFLNLKSGFLHDHIQGLLSFLKSQEGEIMIPNTPFVIHFRASRCTVMGIGKRLLLVDFQKCEASASEESIGLAGKCVKGSQKEAISCATEQVLNLLKVVTSAVQNATAKTTG